MMQLLWHWAYRILASTASGTITEADIRSAFLRGAGVGTGNVSELIAGVAFVFILIWATWVIASDYQGFARGEVSFYDFLWHIMRVAIVAILFSIFVNPD